MELEDIVNEEMITTEDVNDMLEHTDKGRTKQTIRNCVTVLQNDPVLKKAIKRNELSGRMDIVKEVPWERKITVLRLQILMKINITQSEIIWKAWSGTGFQE